MRHLGLVVVAASFFLTSRGTCQGVPITSETKGSCSPIAPNNQGSIVIKCDGFTEKQNKILRDFLNQLSTAQAKDQDELITKLDEILEAVRATQLQITPRVISEETQQNILRSAWGTCPTENVRIVAPHNDIEAEHLATQIRDIFRRGGMNAGVEYQDLKRGEQDPDIKTVANFSNICGLNYVEYFLSPLFVVRAEQIQPPSNLRTKEEIDAFNFDPKVPVFVYVYPKLTR